MLPHVTDKRIKNVKEVDINTNTYLLVENKNVKPRITTTRQNVSVTMIDIKWIYPI